MYATHADLDVLMKRIKALERQIQLMQNNNTPTVPIYDKNNWPQDAVEGQVVISPIA